MFEKRRISRAGAGNGSRSPARPASRRVGKGRGALAMLAGAALIAGLSSQASAQEANHIVSGCSFVTEDLQGILSLPEGLAGPLEASYIIIYVLANPNDGQVFDSESFTGPVLCTSEDTTATTITEADLIPSSGTVNILGAEEVSHLQYAPNIIVEEGTVQGDPEKRVCHTVAGNTDCFLIRPQPIIGVEP